MAEIVNMPKLGFDMAEGTLVRWVINEQEAVEKGQVLAEIETDKATVEVESPFTGIVRRHLVEQDAVVPVSTPIAVIGESDEEIDFDRLLVEVQEAETAGGEAAESEPDVSQDKVEASITEARREAGFNLPDGVRASPLARRMAEKLGINMRQVKGSGPNGRITKADIESYQAAPQAGQQLQPVVFPAVSGEIPPDRNIPLSKLRTAIGKRMVQSKVEFPQFFVTHEFDVAALIDLRRQVNALLAEGEKTSINDYLVKAAALALREFPNLNAQLGTDGKSVTQFGHVNIGVAVAVDNGLLTVVCRDADLKPVQQISMEIREMAGRAREGKVRADDIEGSTFSVSNLGMFDVEEFIAIINPPEAAILAIGSANQVAVVEDKRVVPGWRMKATISVDHRVSDGAEAARFMQALTRYVEEPLRLILPDLSGQAAS